MKLTNEMREQIKAIAAELCCDYEVFGVRIQSREFSLGEIRHLSHVWVDGDDTGDELDGISAQNVTTLGVYNNEYFGSHAAVIAGNTYTYGEDAGEIVIEDAVVVAILA